jgi:hypothetical protein
VILSHAIDRPALPPDIAKRFGFADYMQEAGFGAGAIALLVPLLRAYPDHLPGRILLAIALADIGSTGAAIEVLRGVVELAPDEPAGWTNLGMLLKIEGEFGEAAGACDRAVALRPDVPQIRLNRGIALLRAGRLREGWPDYEARLSQAPHPALPAEARLPPLSEIGDGAGRTVLLIHEQGFGDTLQMVRYAPLLAARGFRVVVWAPAPLVPLLRRAEGVAEVLAPGAPAPPFDFHCPFFSLPLAFATTLESIPAAIPYITADPVLTAGWGDRLADREGLRVGLVWAGQGRPWLPGFEKLDRRRSMRLADLAPLGEVPGISLVSLQMGDAADAMRAAPPVPPLYDAMQGAADFGDTAAIVANLDVVVSVDTSVVHLAGALGKKVMLLDRYDNCWRWLAGREDSPWYPSLRIFRQARIGDWAPVVERVAAALRDMAA